MSFLSSAACSILSMASDLSINSISYFSFYCHQIPVKRNLSGVGFILRIRPLMVGRQVAGVPVVV